MSKEAMTLALDELRYVLDCINKDKIPFDGDDFHEAIKALEEALAKQEHDLQDTRCECCGYMTYQREHMGCIRSAKQEQGEPDKYVMDIECTKCGAKQSGILTVNTTPQVAKQEQGEPDDEVLGFNGWGFPIEHPPKLKREPLTDDELKPHIEIAMKYYGYDSTKYGLTATSGFVWLARAIEAAHGIKENT